MNSSSIAKNASDYDNTPYTVQRIEPDAVSYASQFYAKTHIPSFQERPGNNTFKTDVYTKYNPNYNIYCYK